MLILGTGQDSCYDPEGRLINCLANGQDGEFRSGFTWPQPRFSEEENQVVCDQLTGLFWTKNANLAEFPLTWKESLAFIKDLNTQSYLGFDDWRLPNRREMRSLMSYQTSRPALPSDHPFTNVFLGWYWTSTTAAINQAYAWYVHLEGARMFYGRKDQYYLLWPVRGKGNKLAQTGQQRCYDQLGNEISCNGSGQDGENQSGIIWPEPRFVVENDLVLDRLTNITWLRRADYFKGSLDWQESLLAISQMNQQKAFGLTNWSMPNINMLESLVDASAHTPALPQGHPFIGLQDVYWSSTTSFFETDWAWALYLDKGACGVGFKKERLFAWPVAVNSE